MYEYIRGTLIALSPTKAIVEAHGIGFSLDIPANTPPLPVGDVVLFYIAHIVREDSERLFGFATSEQRSLFLSCSEVSGIGPKTALNIVGHVDSDTLREAIHAGNANLLRKIPGIGKKIADRLILEMKDRLPAIASGPSSDLFLDATSALVNLGYQLPSAQKAVKAAMTTPVNTLSELISKALQEHNSK